MPRVPCTIITPTIPGREALTARAIKSVFDQTMQPEYHIIVAQDLSDNKPQIQHVSEMRNYWIDRLDTPWVAFLDDDNYYLPYHLERLWDLAVTDAYDLVYADQSLAGDSTINCNGWTQEDLIAFYRTGNLSDINGFLIRTEFLQRIGGFSRTAALHDDIFKRGKWEEHWRPGYHSEEWDLMVRAANAGGRFRFNGEHSWVISTETYDKDDPTFATDRYGQDGPLVVTNAR